MRLEYCIAGNIKDLEVLMSYIKSLHRKDNDYVISDKTVICNSATGDLELLPLGRTPATKKGCLFMKVETEEKFSIAAYPFFICFPEICEAKYTDTGIEYKLYKFAGSAIGSQKPKICKISESSYKAKYQKYFVMGVDRRWSANDYETELVLATV